MLPSVIGLLGAAVYGAADFLGGLAAKRLRSVLVTAIAAASGLVILLAAAPLFGASWGAADIAWGALSGVFGVFAIVLLYACLAIGPMSILSPLTAVVSAIAPMLWGLLIKGEQLSVLGYLGLLVALVAVVLVGFIPGQKVVRPSLRGVLMAIGSGIAIGAFLIAIDQTSDESGLAPLIANRATNAVITFTAVGVIALVALRRRGSRRAATPEGVMSAPVGIPLGATPTGHADLEHATGPILTLASTAKSRREGVWLAVACGIVDTAANVLTLVALRLGDLAIVSVLTAMYPAGTILLAGLVLRERIAAIQWAGLALALTAAAMFALA